MITMAGQKRELPEKLATLSDWLEQGKITRTQYDELLKRLMALEEGSKTRQEALASYPESPHPHLSVGKPPKQKKSANSNLLQYAPGLVVIAVVGYYFFTGPTTSENQIAEAPTQKTVEQVPEFDAQLYRELSTKQAIAVCRATIAVLMGRDVNIIKGHSLGNGVIHTDYKRPDDGKRWQARCKFEGNRVIWASYDAFGPGTGAGRWRNEPEDAMITFSLEDNGIRIAEDFGGADKIIETINVTY